ncbi:MAG: HAMP domain-containing sensor histidine kinase [Pseudomonadota bacterium]
MSKPPRSPSPVRSLSARLLLLTMAFVLLGEVLIYVPSISRFRKVYIEERIAAGHLATLSLEASASGRVDRELESELLSHAGVLAVTLHAPRANLMLGRLPAVERVFDLRQATPWGLIVDAFDALWHGGDRTIRALAPSPQDPGLLVDVSMREQAMWNAMVDYSWRIVNLSIVLSLLTALLVYLSLQLLMVLPLRRITESVMAFRSRPEDTGIALKSSSRRDEIGVVQTELANMQSGLRQALAQKTRLAALGAAVSKINHDLRNLLANAMLLSDSLDISPDPKVKQIAPRLVESMERAAKLCSDTLNFARAEKVEPEKRRFPLKNLVDEVIASVDGQAGSAVRWRNEVDDSTIVSADRDQLFRVLMNLGRNAQQAMQEKADADQAGLVSFVAWQSGRELLIEVADTGPGIPESARERLFDAFSGSTRPGGTGLGLAIAREIMRAHGGEIELDRSDAEGTAFRLCLPAG